MDTNEFKFKSCSLNGKSLEIFLSQDQTLGQLKELLKSNSDLPLILDLQAVKEEGEIEVGIHKPQFPILANFEKERGIYDLINVAVAVVKTYKS